MEQDAQLTDRHSPSSKHVFMEEYVRGLWWVDLWVCQLTSLIDFPHGENFRVHFLFTYLPTDCITCDGGKSSVPQPAEDFCGRLDSSMLRAGVVRISLFLSICHGRVPLLGHSYTNEKNITLLERDVVLLGNFEDIGKPHLVGRECGVFNPSFLRPCSIVDQDSTSYCYCEIISGDSCEMDEYLQCPHGPNAGDQFDHFGDH